MNSVIDSNGLSGSLQRACLVGQLLSSRLATEVDHLQGKDDRLSSSF